MEGTPLLDVMRGLILEPEAQADFAADPSGYMQRFGYDDVPEDDLREAVGLVADTLPPDVAHAVNTAAAAEPGDDDAYGDGTVGLLGRISTAEVTESVVPELDELPPDDAGPDETFDDDLAGDHDTTTFGEVTRDFDEDASETADEGVADDDRVADEHDEADDADAGAPGDAGQDVSYGDGGFDDGSLDVGDGPEAFGHGSPALDSGADVDDYSAGGDYDTGPGGPGDEAGPAIDPTIEADVGDDSFDDPGYQDAGPGETFDDGFGLDDAATGGDDQLGYDGDDPDFDGPGAGDFDGDVGQF
jgi:hypothetical protein